MLKIMGTYDLKIPPNVSLFS